MKSPEEHGAEHDRIASGGARQYLPPRQVTQACEADPESPGVRAQALIESRGQHALRPGVALIAVHVEPSEGCGRLADVLESLAEEALVLDCRNTETHLCNEVAEQRRGCKCRTATFQ